MDDIIENLVKELKNKSIQAPIQHEKLGDRVGSPIKRMAILKRAFSPDILNVRLARQGIRLAPRNDKVNNIFTYLYIYIMLDGLFVIIKT